MPAAAALVHGEQILFAASLAAVPALSHRLRIGEVRRGPEPRPYDPRIDVYLAIASRREVRDYTDDPIPDEIVHRILDAGRLAGSSRNTQQWEFVIVSDHEALAGAVYAPDNVRGAKLVVAIAGTAFPFDFGRAAENMMLEAWNEGVGSCPNGVSDAEAAERIVGAKVGIVLTFGYPAKPRDVNARSAEEWSAKAKRKPYDEVVREA